MRGPTSFVVLRGTRRLQGSITPPGGDVATPPVAADGRPATAARVALGTYRCVMFVTNQLVNSGEFTITGPGTYRGGGTNGTYTYDVASGLVRFHGASFDGQKADYESATRPRFQVYGPSGRRGALSCDGPPR